jgi:AcrR family transcriptional regulator
MEQSAKSERTKQLILDESYKMFYEQGFKATSIDKIMRVTQLTKGAFYHHFKSKQELGLAIITSKLQKRIYDKMISPLYEAGDPSEILMNTFNRRLNSFTMYEKQHGCALNNFINEIADYESAYQMAMKRIVDEWKAGLVHLIDRGKNEMSFRNDLSSTAIAIYIISAFEGVRGIRKLYNDDTIIEEYKLAFINYIQQLKK